MVFLLTAEFFAHQFHIQIGSLPVKVKSHLKDALTWQANKEICIQNISKIEWNLSSKSELYHPAISRITVGK